MSDVRGIVLEDDLVDDARSGLPEANAVLGGRGREEVVDLLVDVLCAGEVLDALDLGLNQVVAVDGRRNSRLRHAGRHELEKSHLGGGILASNTLKIGKKGEMKRKRQSTRPSSLARSLSGWQTHVRAELEVRLAANDLLCLGLVEVAVDDLLRERQGSVKPRGKKGGEGQFIGSVKCTRDARSACLTRAAILRRRSIGTEDEMVAVPRDTSQCETRVRRKG